MADIGQPAGQSAGGGLADLLGGVNRPALNTFVATSQARNGLVSAQTQDALIKAQQAQEDMSAHADLPGQIQAAIPGIKGSEATLMANIMSHIAGGAEGAAKFVGQLKLGYGSPEDQTAGQQMFEGKIAPPVTVPNNFQAPAAPPGGSALGPVQQSPQGVAQTAQTQAVTAKDIADAEEAHAKAKNAVSPASALDPGTTDMAARVVMADPTKMSQYAGFGQAGQNNKNAINNRQAQLLTAAGMTPDDMIRQRAIAKANIGSTAQAAKQAETLDAYLPLVKANSNRISQLLDQIDATGVSPDTPIVNGFSRLLGRNLGDDDLAELHSLFGSYQKEVARLLTAGPSMNGVISDHSQEDVKGMAPENMTSSQARRVLNRIDVETSIRRQGVQSALEAGAATQLPVISPNANRTGGTTQPPAAAPAAAGAPALPAGLTLVN